MRPAGRNIGPDRNGRSAECALPHSPSRERFERLYRAIRDGICLFEYPPGGRLSEEELAQKFSVSRTPVRRVLARLEADGLIETRHGVGNFVTSVRLDEIAQLYQLRVELAVLIGRLSPVPRTRADLDRIRALIARCDLLSRKPEYRAFARLNMDFFFELNSMTGNASLREVSERLYFLAARSWLQLMPKLDLAEEFAAFRREMEEVLTAAEIGDIETVGHIRRTHIAMSFARMVRYLGKSHAGELTNLMPGRRVKLKAGPSGRASTTRGSHQSRGWQGQVRP